MFTRAAPMIANNLWQGGLSQAQSSSVAGALGQCNAPLVHRGPVTVDYTSPTMQQITFEGATYNYPTFGMNPPEALPPKPPYHPPEEPPPEGPEPFPPQPPIGQPGYHPNWPGTGGGGTTVAAVLARAGKYLRVPAPATVELSYQSDKEDYVCTFNNKNIVGVDFIDLLKKVVGEYLRVEGGKLELSYKDDDDDKICTFSGEKIAGKSLERIIQDDPYAKAFSYVRDIYLDGNSLKVNYGTAIAFEPTDSGTSDIPTSTCQP